MALSFISGLNAVASVMLGTEDWTPIMQRCRIRFPLPQQDTTTFLTENVGDSAPGVQRATFDFFGLMAKGAAQSGPILPSAYQNKAISVDFDTSCTVSATCNAQDGGADRSAGNLGVVDASFLSKGAITIDWDLGTP